MMLWALFSSFFFKKKRKKSKPQQTSFLMLENKKSNLRATIDSFSITLSKEIEILDSFINFKQMEMVKFKESLNSQEPLDWLKTHVHTIGENTSTMIWEICHVKGGGIRAIIKTTICLL